MPTPSSLPLSWSVRARAAAARSFSIDPRALGLTRVVVGCVTFAMVALRSPGLTTFYSDQGVLPTADWARLHPHFVSLHGLSGDSTYLAALFVLHGLAALALALGVHTRLATFATWALTVSLAVRNPLLNDGADALLGMLLFWGNFVPWGARLSVDSVRRGGEPPRSAVFTVGTVGLLLQMPLVYGITSLQKHTPAWRETFDAVYYSLNNDLIASRLGVALGGAPRGLLRALTVFTLAAEVALPFLLLAPLRSARVRLFGVLLSGSLQVGFFLCFDVGIFPFVSTAAVLPFLPSFALDALGRRPSLRRAHGRLVEAAQSWIPRTSRAPSLAPVSPWGRTVAASLCAAAIAAVVASNLSSVGAFALPTEATKALSVLRLGQGWMMFASPSTQAGWYVALGKRTDGHVVDLLHPGDDVRWDKPAHVSSAFASRDERKLFSILRADAAKPYRAGVTRYLCALPQGEGAPPLRAIRLHFRARPIGGTGLEEPTDTLVLHDKCPRGARDPESVAAR